MNPLNKWFLGKTNVPLVLGLIALAALLIVTFNQVFTPAFRAVTAGHDIIDLQIPITPEMIYAQLPDYTAASARLYTWFIVADFIFPAAAALAVAFFWAWLFKAAPNPLYSALLRVPIFALPLLTGFFDWMENVGFLTIVYCYPVELPLVASISCAIRSAKLFVMSINGSLSTVFIAITLGFWLYGRFFRSQETRT